MVTSAVSPLSKFERQIFDNDKSAVRIAMKSFATAGLALKRIYDGDLYREEYETFEGFCRGAFNLSFSRAVYLMETAGVHDTIERSGISRKAKLPLPENAHQAAQLIAVPKREQPKVWAKAVKSAPRNEDGTPHITGEHVKQVVNDHLHPEDSEDGDTYWVERKKQLIKRIELELQEFPDKHLEQTLTAITQVVKQVRHTTVG